MTAESSENVAITLSCINFFGYVGHVSIFIVEYLLFSSGVTVRF